MTRACTWMAALGLVLAGSPAFSAVGTGHVSGTVKDAATGLPLANVWVGIYEATTGNMAASAEANSSGVYTSEGLASGIYYGMTSNSHGYIDQVYDAISCPGGGCWATTGTPIRVTDAATTTGIDFNLTRGGGVAGAVTDAATGVPLANVRVIISTALGRKVASATTNSSGLYTIDTIAAAWLGSGLYYAQTTNQLGYMDELYEGVACPALACAVTSGTPISVLAGATTAGIDFALTTGGRTSGTVTDAATKLPLPNVGITIFDAAGHRVADGLTNSSGAYTSSGLPSGTYYARASTSLDYLAELYKDIPCPGGACTVTSGTPISVTYGATTTGIDFALTPGGRISGAVTDAGTSQPLANVNVNLYNSAGGLVTSVPTNGSGAYTLHGGLVSGTYYVATSSSQGYSDELYNDIPCPGALCTVTSGTPISVTAGATTTGIDLALTTGGRITGSVTDAATGLALAQVSVSVYDPAGRLVTETSTNSSGLYATNQGLTSGTYYVQTRNTLGYMNELYNDVPCLYGCTVTSGTPVSVTTGATTTGIDFGLTRGGHITGRVTDAVTGLPIADAYVQVSNSAGADVEHSGTDSAGVYTIDRLSSGTYYVQAGKAPGYNNVLYKDIPCPYPACTVTSGTPISVTLGATTAGIAFSLTPGGGITGIVRDAATRQPIPAYVSIYDSAGVFAARTQESNGAYIADGLAPGTYYARTEIHDPRGYVDELYDNIPCPGGACTVTSGTPIIVTAGATRTADFDVQRPTPFYTVEPCRVADTRDPVGAWGGPALVANGTRTFPVIGRCGVPTTATAVAINVTVVDATDGGDLRLHPAGTVPPAASTINFSAGRVRANNAVVALGSDGQILVRCDMPPGSKGQTHFLFDVTGYFQ